VIATDLRYAIRMLARHPGFAVASILALALGIGVNTTIFGFVDGLLFRPLPVERLDEVVRIGAVDPERDPHDLYNSSYPIFIDYRSEATAFEGLAAYTDSNAMNLSLGEGQPERLTGAIVSGEYFQVLRTKAWRGRLITGDDDRVVGGHPVVVISYGLWRRLFGSGDRTIGQKIHINSYPFTVIGVAPPGFVGVSLDNLPELWVPMAMTNQAMPGLPADFAPLTSRHFFWLNLVGRLKPGMTIPQAQSQLDVIATRRAAGEPREDREPFAKVVSAASLVTQTESSVRYRRMSWVLVGVVGLVLLIACADAAGLLLVRAEQRQKEIAVRLAMGATRGRIIRQLLVESLLLAALASVAGVLLASWSGAGLLTLLPTDFPLTPTIGSPTSEPRVLLFTVLVTLTAGLAFGLAPAWRASRPALVPALKQEATALGRRRVSLRHVFVVGELALSVLLLVGAGLLVRTVHAFTKISPGFDTTSVLVASTDVALQGYSEERGRAFFDALRTRVAALPGVTSAALGRMVPVQSSGMRVTFNTPGTKASGPDGPVADYNPISPDFFRTLGIPVVQGRDFGAGDIAAAPHVLIVNRALVRKYFGGRSPLGIHLADFGPAGNNPEIVGVVDDARYRTLRDEAAPMIYAPLAQNFMPGMSLVVKTQVPPASLEASVREAVASLDAELPLYGVQTIGERMRASLEVERLLAWLLAAFAGLAVVLATAGLYGVISYVTTLRTKEFGIRLALGATSRQVYRLVLRQSLVLVTAGLGLGLLLAGAVSRLLTSLLFDVSPTDVMTYTTVVGLLSLVGVAAAMWPARRAARISAATALRYE
jgi:putative ABC transport system permease protein